jgi:hypothetical protein
MRTIASALAVLWLVACSDADDSAREQPASDCPSVDLTAAKSWKGGIGTLFAQRCGACHPGTQPTDYKSFEGVKGNIDGEMDRVDDGTMPPGGMPDAEKAAMRAWVKAGLPESSPDDQVCE